MVPEPYYGPSILIRDCSSCFVSILTNIFNLCLNDRIVPDILKNGDKSKVENYRSISMLSKVFEILYNRIYAFQKPSIGWTTTFYKAV